MNALDYFVIVWQALNVGAGFYCAGAGRTIKPSLTGACLGVVTAGLTIAAVLT